MHSQRAIDDLPLYLPRICDDGQQIASTNPTCHAQMHDVRVLFQGRWRAPAWGDLYRGCELRRLIDRGLRIQFGGLISTTNQIH